MARKFAKRYLKPTAFEPKNSIFEGLVWNIKGSKKDSSYNVTLSEKGFECECTGFNFHGYCKHSKSVLERVEQAVNGDVPQYRMT